MKICKTKGHKPLVLAANTRHAGQKKGIEIYSAGNNLGNIVGIETLCQGLIPCTQMNKMCLHTCSNSKQAQRLYLPRNNCCQNPKPVPCGGVETEHSQILYLPVLSPLCQFFDAVGGQNPAGLHSQSLQTEMQGPRIHLPNFSEPNQKMCQNFALQLRFAVVIQPACKVAHQNQPAAGKLFATLVVCLVELPTQVKSGTTLLYVGTKNSSNAQLVPSRLLPYHGLLTPVMFLPHLSHVQMHLQSEI